MARIELVNLAHSYKAHPNQPSDYALHPMTMTWDDGGAYALLGPSGSVSYTHLRAHETLS
jgi:glycerol transport system ATP-binding protein